MNLEAGQRAKSRAAFSAALEYFEAGLRLLSAESWEKHYRLTLNLHREATEAAGISGGYSRMEVLADAVHTHASNLSGRDPNL